MAVRPDSMRALRRACFRSVSLLWTCSALMLALPASAQSAAAPAPGGFPDRPLRLVVPFPPGGAIDLVARMVQPALTQQLGQQVIVDNRPGANGVIATALVTKAAPDGYTLFLSWDHTITPLSVKNLPYDIFKDLAPITLLVKVPLVMAAWKELPADSLSEFVALAKKEPGKLNFASIGPGSSVRLYSEWFNQVANINVVNVSYKGGGQAVQAIASGEVAYGFFSVGAVRGQMQAGRIKPLAVTSTTRIAELSSVPTMAEQGFPGFETSSWMGIYAPAGTPRPVVDRLNRALVAALSDPQLHKSLVGLGMEVVVGSPEELARYQEADFRKWDEFVRSTRLRLD